MAKIINDVNFNGYVFIMVLTKLMRKNTDWVTVKNDDLFKYFGDKEFSTIAKIRLTVSDYIEHKKGGVYMDTKYRYTRKMKRLLEL